MAHGPLGCGTLQLSCPMIRTPSSSCPFAAISSFTLFRSSITAAIAATSPPCAPIKPSLSLSHTHARSTEMRCLVKSLSPLLRRCRRRRASIASLRQSRFHSAMSEDPRLGEFLDFMDRLKNYERLGVPRDAGTDSDDGFDLGRMRRLLERLGNPHTHFKAVHIAGTKGKGSTAAFLSNILQEEGYSVGCYTSPHLLTIRERISVGRNGHPISTEVLNSLFHQARGVLDHSIDLENGALTHFEVLTALAFSAFSREKVDIAIIEAGLGGARDATNVLRSSELAASVITSIGEEHLSALGGSLESIAQAKSGIIKHGRPLVIGGPFEPVIETIIRNKATSMSSPVVSASDPRIQSVVKGFQREDGQPYQICDILINVLDDLRMFIDLPNLKLKMLGDHQLKNAITAVCTALCIRDQGLAISERSIRAGLEQTRLLGRSQILTPREAEAVGLCGVSILIDGAHTKASAKGLTDILKMMNAEGGLALLVAMASDKDHVEFARQILSGRKPDIVLLSETTVAGGKSRTTSVSVLKDAWNKAAVGLGVNVLDIGIIGGDTTLEDHLSSLQGLTDTKRIILAGCLSESTGGLLKVADLLLRSQTGAKSGLITVTGSLHIVGSVLRLTEGSKSSLI